MKIGIDIRTLMDEYYSGVSEYTYNLVRELLRLDKVNEYKLFYNSGRDVSARIPRFKQENVEIVSSRYPNKVFNYIMQKSLRLPKIDSRLGVDLFFMPHINFIALSGAARSVITIHDLSYLRYPELFSTRKNIWHNVINVKNLISKFDRVVAVSKSTAEDIIRLGGVREDKVRVIYSGIDSTHRPIPGIQGSEAAAGVIKKYSLPEKFILFLGTLEPRKNIDGLIQAYNSFRADNPKLGHIKLVIAGARGWKADGIIEAWRNSPRQNDIRFIGYVDTADKVALYNLAEVFVYPSFYEGFGFPPLEAMACGCPTVVGNNSSLAEITRGGALLIDPKNIAEIASALSSLINGGVFKENLKERGTQAASIFSWAKTAREYSKFFKEIC